MIEATSQLQITQVLNPPVRCESSKGGAIGNFFSGAKNWVVRNLTPFRSAPSIELVKKALDLELTEKQMFTLDCVLKEWSRNGSKKSIDFLRYSFGKHDITNINRAVINWRSGGCRIRAGGSREAHFLKGMQDDKLPKAETIHLPGGLPEGALQGRKRDSDAGSAVEISARFSAAAEFPAGQIALGGAGNPNRNSTRMLAAAQHKEAMTQSDRQDDKTDGSSGGKSTVGKASRASQTLSEIENASQPGGKARLFPSILGNDRDIETLDALIAAGNRYATETDKEKASALAKIM